MVFGGRGSIGFPPTIFLVGGIYSQLHWSGSQRGNPLDFGWTSFQNIFILRYISRGNPNQSHGKFGSRNYSPQDPLTQSYSAHPRLPFLATLNFPYLLKLMNDLVCHDPT